MAQVVESLPSEGKTLSSNPGIKKIWSSQKHCKFLEGTAHLFIPFKSHYRASDSIRYIAMKSPWKCMIIFYYYV
jgi:hypothetical protein